MIKITNIQEIRDNIVGKEEIRESVLTEDLTTFCYMISAENTFDNPWARECRGIVFNRFGKVCGRPLHKFFNLNERPETQANVIDWSKVVRVMEKRDGSMIHTVINSPEILLKSKKSASSDVAKAAVLNRKPEVVALCEHVAELDCTAIFEYTAPTARIVLYYPEIELTLLHVRENASGRYWTWNELFKISKIFNVPLVQEITEFWDELSYEDQVFYFNGQTAPTRLFNIQRMLDAADTYENIEGWVIQFADGEMVKIKTSWYLKRHRCMTFLRERDIADLVLSEGLDDLKSLLVGDGINIDEIIKIEDRVIEDIRKLEHDTISIAPPEDFQLPRKDFVMKHRVAAADKFGLLMDLYSGKQPNYVYFFEKNMFKQNYGLDQLHLIPSVAEAD